MADSLDEVLSGWVRLGVLFGVPPLDRTPDIEELLIDTVKILPSFARLLPTTVTWLFKFGHLIARHRLARMAKDIREAELSARLGLALDFAQECMGTDHLNVVVGRCRRCAAARPLFDVDRRSLGFEHFAKETACPLSKRWGLWTDQPQLKLDAIRPAAWVMANNPELMYRAVFSGNLRASIIACLSADASCGRSESELARTCGVTRPALREALDHLELCGLVRRAAGEGTRSRKIELQRKKVMLVA